MVSMPTHSATANTTPPQHSEEYATIDNALVRDNLFEDASCTSSPVSVPAGWRIADWDVDVAYVSIS